MKKLIPAVAGALLLWAATPAQAVIVASFAAGASDAYSYTTGGGTATLSGMASGVIIFSGASVAAGAPAGPILATIDLLATSTTAVDTSGSPATQDGFTGTIEIVGTSGMFAGVTLLTATFSGANLDGVLGGSTASFFASDATAGESVDIEVPFFAVTDPEDFRLELVDLDPLLAVDPATGFYVPFVGSDGSSYSGTIGAVIPEPSTFALAGIGIMGLLGVNFYRRRSQLRRASA